MVRSDGRVRSKARCVSSSWQKDEGGSGQGVQTLFCRSSSKLCQIYHRQESRDERISERGYEASVATASSLVRQGRLPRRSLRGILPRRAIRTWAVNGRRRKLPNLRGGAELDRRYRDENRGHGDQIDGSANGLTRTHFAGATVPKSPTLSGSNGLQHFQSHPLLSMVISTRNRLNQLKRCVDAALSVTTQRDWELIIVDNGSYRWNKRISGLYKPKTIQSGLRNDDV